MKRSRKILIYKICCIVFAAVLLMLPQRGLLHSDIRVLITVLGIDGGMGNVSVSAQLAIPVAQGTGGQASTVAKADGGSLAEALENLEIGLGRRIDYGHLSTVAVGKDMALGDLKKFIECLLSSGKAGPGSYLVYCSDTEAAKFIEQAQQMGETSDAELGSFISYSKSGNHVSTTSALKFMQGLNSSSHAAFLPCVQLEDESSGDGQQSDDKEGGGNSGGSGGDSSGQEEQGGAGSSEGGSGGKKKLVAADSVAVFGGFSEKAVVLDSHITRGLVWQDTMSDSGLVELRNICLEGRDIPSVPARLTAKSVRKKVSSQNGENTLTYKIKIRLRLEDGIIFGNPLVYANMKDALEKMFESMIASNIDVTVAASKDAQIDFLGLKECFHKYCRRGYESFDLNTVTVKTDAKVIIQT